MSGVGASSWNTQLQYRTTQTNPSGSPVWSAWAPLVVSYATFWGAQFQLLVTTNDNQVTPVVETLTITVDMPPRSLGGLNVSAPSTGLTVNFSPAFLTLSSLTVSPMNGNPGDI